MTALSVQRFESYKGNFDPALTSHILTVIRSAPSCLFLESIMTRFRLSNFKRLNVVDINFGWHLQWITANGLCCNYAFHNSVVVGLKLSIYASSDRSIDDHAKDGGPGRSDLDVVFTMTLCATNFFIW